MGKQAARTLGKRKAAPSQSKPTAKKTKPANVQENGNPKRKADQPKKVKLRDQKIIPVPKSIYAAEQGTEDEGDGIDSDMLENLGEDVGAEEAGFLAALDPGALSRTVKETKRLHDLSKTHEPVSKGKKIKSKTPVRAARSDESEGFDSDPEFDSDLQSDIGSNVEVSEDDDDEGSLGSDEDDDELDDDDLNAAFDDVSSSDEEEFEQRKRKKKEEETSYELAGRSRWARQQQEEEGDEMEVGRLPIKLPTGEIQMVQGSTMIARPPSKKPARKPESESEEEDEVEEEDSDEEAQAQRMAGLKGKFGRMGIAEIVGKKGWKNVQRLEAAKEQVAQLGSEILAGGELVDISPLLTRLQSFGLPTVPSLNEGEESLPVPASIRGLVFLSQLAVYKDLVPGYRIRELTATEEAEKVRDEVKRLREGEKLLVKSYKGYLKTLESEIKAKSNLASIALKCLCELLMTITHFNYSENIMGVCVGRLGRRGWDGDSDLVLQTFITVFKNDVAGTHAQTLVRLLARMIKERHYQVHPNVLFCLLHLRLKDELDQMRRGKNAKGKNPDKKEGEQEEKKFKSDKRKKWATKNQRKKDKELKEVAKEMAEAEAEIDKEERAQVQTETLKNLFVLYFSILKNPKRTPLLPAALEGISTYAHFINIDFFRDLLVVLRKVMADQQIPEASNKADDDDEGSEDESPANQIDAVGASQRTRIRLLAIVTAFDLLSGQGEALNIDLSDFINQLFGLLRPLCLDTGIEDPPPLPASTKSTGGAVHTLSTSALLFRCLNASFLSRHSKSPPYRSAAFAKRLTECALHFPPSTAKQAIAFSRALMSKEPKIEGLLDTEERMADGAYRPEIDDPQLVNTFTTSWWESGVLGTWHWDRTVRLEMGKLRDRKVV